MRYNNKNIAMVKEVAMYKAREMQLMVHKHRMKLSIVIHIIYLIMKLIKYKHNLFINNQIQILMYKVNINNTTVLFRLLKII